MNTAFFSSLWLEGKSRAWAYAGVGALGAALSFGLSLAADQRALLRRHVDAEAADIVWMVFLKDGADREVIEESARSFPGLQAIRFVSKDEAYESLQKDDVLSQSLTLTGRNPLPDAFDIRWAPLHLRVDYLEHITRNVEALPGVASVGFDRARVRRIEVLQRFLYRLELAMAAAFWTAGLIGVLLTGKLLFFPGGPWPGERLLLSAAAGAAGGAAGMLGARPMVSSVSGLTLFGAAAAGLLIALLHDAFQTS